MTDIPVDQHMDAVSGDININKLNQAIIELTIANKELALHKEEAETSAANLIKATRLYAFISQINQAIVHIPDELTLFQATCRIAIDIGKFEQAWISIPDTATRKLNLVAHCEMSEGELDMLNNVNYVDNGSTGTVLRTGKSYVVNDFSDMSVYGDAKKYAAFKGFRSGIALPIKRAGKTIGTFHIFSYKINLFDHEEIRLLEEATADISFALDVFEKEKHRREMESKIAHSELRLKQAQSIAHFGSWELNYITGIAEWSEELCKIYGLSPHDNIQSYPSWISFIHPEDLEYTKKITNDARRSGTSIAFHHRIIRRDGVIRYLYSQAEFEFDKDGNPVSLHGVAHDITDMKIAEIERTKIIADIVQRNNDLEQFSYIISHNLRAPVANILGLVNIIQTIGIEKDEADSTTEFLKIAAQNLDHVIVDINHILEIKNNVSAKRETINFRKILNEIQLSISNRITDEQAIIYADFSAAPEITTVNSYLYSIFYNLISNSLKYHRPGVTPVIHITSLKTETGIRVIFNDNGLGIDLKKNSSNIFGLYKRFHHHVEGKGMGLFMIKTQVESLGGKITLSSEVNKGTQFIIEFETNGITN